MSSKKNKNVVSLNAIREEKEHERKEEKVANLAERFEKALQTKPTPVKDYLNKKRKSKHKKKS